MEIYMFLGDTDKCVRLRIFNISEVFVKISVLSLKLMSNPIAVSDDICIHRDRWKLSF